MPPKKKPVTAKPAIPVAGQLILLTHRLAALEARLGIAPPSTTAPAASSADLDRLERDLRANGVRDPKRIAAARARATALSAKRPSAPSKVPPFNASDPRIVSLTRQLKRAGVSLSDKAIAGHLLRHWLRLHGSRA